MDNVNGIFKPRVAVRLPFRLLAGVILLVESAAVLGTLYVACFRRIDYPPPVDIVWVPGLLWFLRLTYHATFHGRSPSPGFWPFASDRVMQWYFAILFLVVLNS